MKAILLSAGRGTRLLPHTENCPKCLLEIAPGTTLLSWQVCELAKAGISEVVVVAGFGCAKVCEEVERINRMDNGCVRVLENTEYDRMDNLGSTWKAADEMEEDFILLNGDTLFPASVPARLLAEKPSDLRVTVSRKSFYDDDDMKVKLDSLGRLTAVGKDLPASETGAESIGMILFRGQGGAKFRAKLESFITQPSSHLRGYYLAVIDALARETPLEVCEIEGEDWCEIDFPDDLAVARSQVSQWREVSEQVGCEAQKKLGT